MNRKLKTEFIYVFIVLLNWAVILEMPSNDARCLTLSTIPVVALK